MLCTCKLSCLAIISSLQKCAKYETCAISLAQVSYFAHFSRLHYFFFNFEINEYFLFFLFYLILYFFFLGGGGGDGDGVWR